MRPTVLARTRLAALVARLLAIVLVGIFIVTLVVADKRENMLGKSSPDAATPDAATPDAASAETQAKPAKNKTRSALMMMLMILAFVVLFFIAINVP